MAQVNNAPQQNPPYASASLYVGDLAPDVTEALLFEIFSAVGQVASVRVCRDAATRRSLGYAYVNFHHVENAERALDTMNFKDIRGRPCRIMWSHRDPSLRKSGQGNIFVKNLAKSIDTKTLNDTFSVFGNILSCKVAMNSKRESLGYGFVHYETQEMARAAIESTNGKLILNETVTVEPFKSKKERGGDKNKFTNVYVKNLPESFNKDKLDEMFSKYGDITSSMVAMSSNDEKEAKCKGFGFVNYKTAEQANAAVDALNNSNVGGKQPLYVGRAQKKEEREKELRDSFEAKKAERQKKFQGVNLYVKNLAENIDDERLTAEFKHCGNITSAHVMRDKEKKSRGFGFVCFATPEEAQKAVSEMNGHMLEQKPLYVAMAQRKDVRRAHLEQQYAARMKGQMGPQGPPFFSAPQGPYMFQGVPNQMFYPPPQMMGGPRRAPWNNQQNPNMMVNRGPMNQYQLMPINNGNQRGMGPQQGQRGGGRGGRGGGRGGQGAGPNKGQMQGQIQQGGRGAPLQGQQRPQQGGPQQGNAQQGNFKYNANARNQQQQPNASSASSQATDANDTNASSDDASAPLTAKALAAAPEEQRKQMLGERLFPLIAAAQPEQAGKITGMLLEMDNGELLHLLDSQNALNDKIEEALIVLKQNGDGDAEEDGEKAE
jgi:polyadenylate-binding protein